MPVCVWVNGWCVTHNTDHGIRRKGNREMVTREELDRQIEEIGTELRRLNAEVSFEEVASPAYRAKAEQLMAKLKSLGDLRARLFAEPLTKHSRWKGKIY